MDVFTARDHVNAYRGVDTLTILHQNHNRSVHQISYEYNVSITIFDRSNDTFILHPIKTWNNVLWTWCSNRITWQALLFPQFSTSCDNTSNLLVFISFPLALLLYFGLQVCNNHDLEYVLPISLSACSFWGWNGILCPLYSTLHNDSPNRCFRPWYHHLTCGILYLE